MRILSAYHPSQNILTQEIMTEEIRKDLLHVQKIGLDLYSTFREERFIKKPKRLSDTIHRNNLKTFRSIRTEKKAIESKKKKKKKESAQAQQLMELARVRGFDTKELFKYDLVPSKYFFGKDRLMTKLVKIALTQ